LTASSLMKLASSQQQPAIIDDDHLARMTLGDRQLEREVLDIFVRQTTIILERIAGAEPALAAAAAHTLVGSARGIGAWRVAQAAESLEQAAARPNEQNFGNAVDQLKAATVEATSAIGRRLGKVLRAN
jgi:HPt (histidine-containing phosphotransfer) domain-containing protein